MTFLQKKNFLKSSKIGLHTKRKPNNWFIIYSAYTNSRTLEDNKKAHELEMERISQIYPKARKFEILGSWMGKVEQSIVLEIAQLSSNEKVSLYNYIFIILQQQAIIRAIGDFIIATREDFYPNEPKTLKAITKEEALQLDGWSCLEEGGKSFYFVLV